MAVGFCDFLKRDEALDFSVLFERLLDGDAGQLAVVKRTRKFGDLARHQLYY